MIFGWCYADEEEAYELDRIVEAVSHREAAIKATYMAMKEIGEQWKYKLPLRLRDENKKLSFWDVRVFMQPEITLKDTTLIIK